MMCTVTALTPKPVLPPDIFGEYVPNYPYPKSLSARSSLGTNNHVYYLLTGGPHGPNTYPPIPIGHALDVKDAAKAHLQALDVPPVYKDQKRKNKRYNFTNASSMLQFHALSGLTIAPTKMQP